MSRSPRIRTRAALVAGALAAVLTSTGCGAGQITGTANQVDNSGGGGASVGAVEVRFARIAAEAPSGGEAMLAMRIVNTGSELDSLESASSPVASSVETGGTLQIPAGQVLVVEGDPAETMLILPTADADAPEADAETETETGATEAPEFPTAAGGERLAQIALVGLTEELRSGMSYEVVLNFERAGQVRLDLPIADSTEPREESPVE